MRHSAPPSPSLPTSYPAGVSRASRSDDTPVAPQRPHASNGATSVPTTGPPIHMVRTTGPPIHMVRLVNQGQLRRATDDWSASGIIGRGGFGTVYKGSLDPDGLRTVAIKRMGPESKERMRHYAQEVNVLSSCAHANVVRLLAIATRPRCLAYEYMPNGDLNACLARTTRVLPAEVRAKIARDVVAGLLFLHTPSGTRPGILHRDVKSANLLLGADFRAVISDFGCARSIGPPNRDVAPGTPGYIDPNYVPDRLGRWHYTSANEVFSVGVVLLELLSSLRPVHRSLFPPNLHEHAERALSSGECMAAPDAGWPSEAATALGNLALRCIARRSGDRPKLEEVEEVLGVLCTVCVASTATDLRPAEPAPAATATATATATTTAGAKLAPTPTLTPTPTVTPTPSSAAGAKPAPTPKHEHERLCVVCMDAPPDSRFRPCMHSMCCPECAQRMVGSDCPTCREPIAAFEEGAFDNTLTGAPAKVRAADIDAAAESGDMAWLVTLLSEATDEPSLAERALSNIGSYDGTLGWRDDHAEACVAVVAALMAHPNDVGLNAEGCGAIGRLSARSHTGRRRLGILGACEVVAAALERHTEDPQCALEGCTAVVNLSAGNMENRRRLGADRVCATVVECLNVHLANLNVARVACCAVSSLAEDEENRYRLGQLGAPLAVTAALRVHLTSARAAEKACGAIANLAVKVSANKILLVEAAAPAAVAQALRFHHANPLVAERGLRGLRNMAAENDANQDRIGLVGACEAVVSALFCHYENTNVAKHGCAAVSNLSASEGNRLRLRRAGACAAVISASEAHADDALVVEQGYNALCNLGTGGSCEGATVGAMWRCWRCFLLPWGAARGREVRAVEQGW